MPKDNTKITKIIVSSDDEITDIVCGIIDSPNERVLVTFSDESDLLISPINLRVILETADERGKLVILQIVNNSTGVRNAHLAGLAVIENIALPTENDWVNEKTNRDRRLTPKKEVTKDSVAVIEEEEKDTYDDIVEDAMEKNGEGEEETPLQKKINEVIEKSKSRKKDVVDDLTLDDDIPITYGDDDNADVDDDSSADSDEKQEDKVEETEKNEENKKEENESLVGKDFSVKEGSLEVKEDGSVGEKSKLPLVTKMKDIRNNRNQETVSSDDNKKKFNAGKFFVILGSVLFVAVLVGLIYYYTKPLVKVRVYVSAKQVSVEKTFAGEENILEIDKENLKVPTKSESIETSRSGNVTATGVAFKGENATGSVQVFYMKDNCENAEDVTLAAGQVISTYDGISYTLDNGVTLECNQGSWPTVGITATDMGEEYNLTSNAKFSVTGQDDSVYAFAASAVNGGSKKEYTVLTQADVDKAVEELKKGVEEESTNKLKDKSGDWQIIESSIKNELAKEDISLVSPVGSEVSSTDVTIKMKSSATYFLQNGLLSMVDEMLTKEAKEQNLFDGEGLSLSLGNDVEKKCEATLAEDGSVSIKLTASASIKPNVNKDEIVSKVKSMKWKEGCDYLKSLKFSDKETEIDFSPSNFPDWLKYFPSKQGGVMIEVKEVY